MIDGDSVIGGGAAPSRGPANPLLAVSAEGLSADDLAARLRFSTPPIVARVEDGRVLMDLRTVFREQDEVVIHALGQIAL